MKTGRLCGELQGLAMTLSSVVVVRYPRSGREKVKSDKSGRQICRTWRAGEVRSRVSEKPAENEAF